MAILKSKPTYLLSGQGTGAGTATGAPIDNRHAANYGFLWYVGWAPSALLAVRVSHDGTAWHTHQIVTATTTSAIAQVAGYLPYVQGAYLTGWSTTASGVMHFTPGVING